MSLAPIEAEVRALFEAYEDALMRNDVAAMDAVFWNSPEVVRYGVAEIQYGIDAVKTWRATATPIPPGRARERTRITALTETCVLVSTVFRYPSVSEQIGRQSQTWAKLAEGWRIVHAHVSSIPDSGL
jgi:hypothetical protein